jgi:DNA-binding GntR family transcriptional regulator
MLKLKRIKKHELLRDKIYHTLKAKIIEGDLEEGRKITESEVANLMGVSKTPAREALKSLAVNGFITIKKNKRMEIARVSLRDIQEVYQIRIVLDGLGARLAAERIEHKDIEKLTDIINKMEELVKKKDFKAYGNHANRFHNLIISISDNKNLENIINSLREKTDRYRIKSIRLEGRLTDSFKEHREILKALIEGNPKQISEKCEIHIQNALKNILKNIDN